ncbi:MAG: hypothetical protein ACD_44C00013G0002 [uncultured bacterium]|nr:MAG: hypothetical protein ACD_44C00013G0002 [uncultured bacterium]
MTQAKITILAKRAKTTNGAPTREASDEAMTAANKIIKVATKRFRHIVFTACRLKILLASVSIASLSLFSKYFLNFPFSNRAASSK